MNTDTNSTALDLVAAADAAYQAASDLGGLYCELVNLQVQQGNGNRLPWVAEKTALYGTVTDALLADTVTERRAANVAADAAADAAWRALLDAGLAFVVVDHSDRLKTRPYEITCPHLRLRSAWTRANGAQFRLARYQTMAAAERAVRETIATEIAALSEAV